MRGGYFLQDDIRSFENGFFGINNVEATYIDPQQRKLLEVVFECLESAGVPLEKVSGSNTGCYVGSFTTIDYPIMQSRDIDGLHRYSMTGGMAPTTLSNRISHAFNLNGPSVVLDTACSSSIYCLHVACAALEAGDCDGAIVAASNLIQGVEQQIGMMKAGVLSKTSTCHTFDISADGYARADGIGAVYLKRLSDAIRDGDPIRSVIRGTAVNANGKTQGIALPSAKHQEMVIRKAYAKAGLNFDLTTYVECHGTGTPVGDPIEVDAVSRVFKRAGERRLRVGSVKTNVGHGEATSALSSIIKVTMAPKLKCDENNIEVVTEGQRWQDTNKPSAKSLRRAGINSFGYGGANGHAILENADAHLPSNYGGASREIRSTHPRTTYLLPFSGSTTEALDARVNNLAAYNLDSVPIQDLAYTLGCRRSHMEKRGYVLVSTSSTSYKDSITTANLRVIPTQISLTPPPYAFVFTGQGAQWAQMCMELFQEFDVFRDTIAEMESVLQNLPEPPGWTLTSAILEPKTTSKVMEPVYSQPTCTAIQVALIMLLKSWGVTPSAVVGHSSGEIAAAFAAGFISLADAITVAYYRGYVTATNSSNGGMIAAGVSEDEANGFIKTLNLVGRIRVACINSPSSVTISGDITAIDVMVDYLTNKKLFARKLQTRGQAYHSHHMLALGDEYENLFKVGKPLKPSTTLAVGVTWVSSVTGDILEKELYDPVYWRQNLEMPVRFSTAISRLAHQGSYHLIEIGPHSALELPIKQVRSSLNIGEESLPYSAAIIRNKNAIESVMGMAGRLYLHGHTLSFAEINGLRTPVNNYRVLHDLPAYHWSYAESPLWYEPRANSEFRFRKYPRQELLGSEIVAGNGLEFSWKNTIRLEESPWLRDHKLDDMIVFPGAGYLAIIIEALSQVAKLKSSTQIGAVVHMKNVNILSALILPDDQNALAELFTTLRPTPITFASNSTEWWDFSIVSYRNGISTTHATGTARIEKDGQPISQAVNLVAPNESLNKSAPGPWYKRFSSKGLQFGPKFQTISKFSISRLRNLRHCQAEVLFWQSIGYHDYPIHPVTIDAMLQAAIVSTTAGNIGDLGAKVPTQINSAIFSLDPETDNVDALWSINSNSSITGFGSVRANAELIGPDNRVKIRLDSVRLAPFEGAQFENNDDQRHPMLRVIWKPDPSPGLLTSDGFANYLETATKELQGNNNNEEIQNLAACLNMLGHKNPYLRVLEIGNGRTGITDAAMEVLSAKSPFPRLLSYTTGIIGHDSQLSGSKIDLKTGESGNSEVNTAGMQFDLIILPDQQMPVNNQYFAEVLRALTPYLDSRGSMLTLFSTPHSIPIDGTDLAAIRFNGTKSHLMLIHREDDTVEKFKSTPILIVERTTTAFGDILARNVAQATKKQPQRILFDQVSEGNIPTGSTIISLLEIQNSLFSCVSEVEFDRVKILTNSASNLVWVTAGNLLKGKLPDHSLAFGISRAVMMEQPSLNFFVYDVDNIDKPTQTARNILSVIKQASSNALDLEYMERDGVAHISRFVPDDELNTAFRQTKGTETSKMQLKDVQSAQLSIKTPGQFDSILFKQTQLPLVLAPHEVQVSVKSVGLNAKDFYALGGRVDTKEATCVLEFSGIVEKIGSNVTNLSAGDRVYVMAPSNFRTSEVVPNWACQKLLDTEDLGLICTVPFVYATALYALQNKAALQNGETVLIHSGAGGIGLAAIQLAQLAGAEIFTTVSTEEKKSYLIQKFGLKPENIFSSRNTSFETSLMAATGGRGVDVVLNSLTGDLLHTSWRCCGAFGRFVDIGKKDLTECGRLEMEQFLKNVTYTAFDLSEFEKVYLLIGCLGGLGRSLSRWLLERGAKKFVFLGRSGLDRAPARNLIGDLTALGAECKVVRGDVCVQNDVEKMVQAADGLIGGIVQAAMGLSNALFSAMTCKEWRSGICPKVTGTWNIHNATKNQDHIDFFLMTSSISGTVGSATEANYCAGNYFLDNFARYRRSLGLPATAVALGLISEVGYVHENPDVESLLLRKGMQQINEAEMLSIIDISLSRSMSIQGSYDSGAAAQVLTGIEPHDMLKEEASQGVNPVLQSPRASVLARSIHEQKDVTSKQIGNLPAEIAEMIDSPSDLYDAIVASIAKRFGDLVLIPASKVNIGKPLDSYGMDSMIAAEFRSWLYQTFKLDVPFLELLSKTTNVEGLAKAVLQHIQSTM
ncbi:hypothetical protein ABW20_dc0100217 [Dactylellina cionopaga]|nr:hypothetical protein ABW20_dc0100217 [Dactylellina cionopaga]